MYEYLMGGVRRASQTLLSGAQRNDKQQWAQTVLLMFKHEKKHFYYVSSQTLEQITETGHEVLILGDIQQPTGHGPQQTALADPVLSRELGFVDLRSSLLTSVFFCLLLQYPS